MLEGFAGSSSSSQKEGVGSGRGSESKLIEGKAFTAISEDTTTGGFSETESTNREFRIV